MSDPDTRVLVVGGGPAGLTAAFLLARAGIPVTLVERRAAVSGHPRARGLNVRTMELFRSWGLADRLITAAGPIAAHSLRIWADRLAGPERRRTRDDRGAGMAALSPAAPCLCPQYGVESVLRDSATTAGADLRYGHELVALERRDETRVAVVADRRHGRTYRAPARYVLAADGADSTVRRLLGVACTGPGPIARNLSIHFRAELSGYLAGRDLIWCRIDNDRVNGLLMPASERQWLLVVPDAGEDPRYEDLVHAAIGAPADVEVLGAQRYDVTAGVADQFRAGNVFLLGDAAHQWPPAGAFGMNAGIQDAHNLVWKIAAVLGGWAGSGLLDSYQAERRPVAAELIGRARHYFGMLGIGAPAGERADPLGRPAWDLAAILGVVYRSTACGGADPAGPVVCDQLNTARVGARAPHLPLRGGRSVLDLFSNGYVLVGGPGADPAWLTAADAVRGRSGVPVRAWLVGAGHLDGVAWADRYGCDRRVVLVRPDGHIAWESTGAADTGLLGDVLARQTAREGSEHGHR
jgi:putative polyketide hydroxylase